MNDTLVETVIVGCGAVSQFLYGPALQALEKTGVVKVSGLIDPITAHRAKLLASFPSAASYDNLTECPLARNTLVIIASPPKLHCAQSIYALERGATVLCEKPIASTSADGERMLEVAQRAGAVLAVGHFRRFFPASEMLKRIFETMPFGQLRRFSIQEGAKLAWGMSSPALFTRELTPGGVLYDSGIHVVDLLLWWLGAPCEFSYADDAMGGLEANCRIEMLYERAIRGTVRLSRDWATQNRYVFIFDAGTLVYDVGYANRLSLSFNGLPFVLRADLMRQELESGDSSPRLPTRNAMQSFTEQLCNVLAAADGRQPLRVPGEEGVRSLRFIEDCYRRRTLMAMPWFTDEERRAADQLAGGQQ